MGMENFSERTWKGFLKLKEKRENDDNYIGSTTRECATVHHYMRKLLGKSPSKCEHCGQERPTDWSNKSWKYKMVPEDWQALCPPCHFKYDYKPTLLCRRGHPREANTITKYNGGSECVLCRKVYNAEFRKRAKEIQYEKGFKEGYAKGVDDMGKKVRENGASAEDYWASNVLPRMIDEAAARLKGQA